MRRRERKGRSDMTAWQSYASPVGELLLAADEEGLTGLWLAGEKYFPGVPEDAPQETSVLEETKRWLDIYFAGREPDFLPLMEKMLEEAVPMRMAVLETQTCNERAIAFYRKCGFQVIGFDLYAYSNHDPEAHEVRLEMGKKLT